MLYRKEIRRGDKRHAVAAQLHASCPDHVLGNHLLREQTATPDGIVGHQGTVLLGELHHRLGDAEVIPVGLIAFVKRQIGDWLAALRRAEAGGELNGIVVTGTVSTRHRLVTIRNQSGDTANQDILAGATGDAVVSFAAADDVAAVSSIDRVVKRSAKQSVVAVAAENGDTREQRPRLPVPGRKAPFGIAARKLEAGVRPDFIVTGAGVEHRRFHARGSEEMIPLFRHRRIVGVGEKFLVGRVPHQTAQLVPLQEPIETDGNEVVDGQAVLIEVPAEEQHAILPGAAVEPVAERGQERLLRAAQQRQPIGNGLEGVRAIFTEHQITGSAVQAAGQYVVARAAKNPIFARAAAEHVVARARPTTRRGERSRPARPGPPRPGRPSHQSRTANHRSWE